MDCKLSKVEQEAQNFGIDLSLTNYNLSLSLEQRLVNHQRALNLVSKLKKAGQLYEQQLKRPTQTSARSSH